MFQDTLWSFVVDTKGYNFSFILSTVCFNYLSSDNYFKCINNVFQSYNYQVFTSSQTLRTYKHTCTQLLNVRQRYVCTTSRDCKGYAPMLSQTALSINSFQLQSMYNANKNSLCPIIVFHLFQNLHHMSIVLSICSQNLTSWK